MLKILSLGAGVQSTTVLLMSQKGLLPKLDAAIFADTGWEPKEVYEHLERLKNVCATPIVHLNGKNLREEAISAEVRGHKFQDLPIYSETGGMIRRQCTNRYKVQPIRREIQKLRQKRQVELWFGISFDEILRIRSSDVKYIVNVYPLVNQFMTRFDCTQWLKENWPYPVPRSACLGCPFHSDAEWRKIKANPEYWKDVTEFDRAIRHSGGMRGEVFLHRSLKPLEEVDFSTAEDHGQLNLFNNECSGHCGV